MIWFQRFRHSIRGRLIAWFMASTLLVGVAGMYSQMNYQQFLQDALQVFQRNGNFLGMVELVDSALAALEEYLSTKSATALRTYWDQAAKLRLELTRQDRRPFKDQSALLGKDMMALIDGFLTEGELAIAAKRARDLPRYAASLKSAGILVRHIHDSADTISLLDFRRSTTALINFSTHLAIQQILTIITLVLTMGLSMVLGIWFALRLTKPLESLVQAAGHIAGGQLDFPVSTPASHDEIGVLAERFETMRRSLVRHIADLQEKAKLESGLLDEKLKNLRMQHLLKHAELSALQAQINPHFLFNTLNAGVQLAVIEDAEQTRRFMEHLSELLRHNVRRLDRPIMLSDELASLESYFYVIRIRFGKRYYLRIIDTNDHPDVEVPAMILQPLVENSLLHGLADRESGGWVEVRVAGDTNGVRLTVADNGEGIDDDRRRWLLRPESQADAEAPSSPESPLDRTRHVSTGIGLGNVLARIRRHCGFEDAVEIISAPGQGCQITWVVPFSNQGES